MGKYQVPRLRNRAKVLQRAGQGGGTTDRSADLTFTYVFEATAQIAIISNTFVYFDDHLKEVFRQSRRLC